MNKELVIELKQDGANTQVTLANVQDYIDLICHSYFHENIKLQVNAFKKGFNSIFPIESLKCFSHQEIEHLVCGEHDLGLDRCFETSRCGDTEPWISCKEPRILAILTADELDGLSTKTQIPPLCDRSAQIAFRRIGTTHTEVNSCHEERPQLRLRT